jgi:hypothetical protein
MSATAKNGLLSSQQPLVLCGLESCASAAIFASGKVLLACFCRWQNMRTEGKILSFDLLDKDGGEIKATAWNEQVDMINELVEVRGEGKGCLWCWDMGMVYIKAWMLWKDAWAGADAVASRYAA